MSRADAEGEPVTAHRLCEAPGWRARAVSRIQAEPFTAGSYPGSKSHALTSAINQNSHLPLDG
jgi:hypothetical protein